MLEGLAQHAYTVVTSGKLKRVPSALQDQHSNKLATFPHFPYAVWIETGMMMDLHHGFMCISCQRCCSEMLFKLCH